MCLWFLFFKLLRDRQFRLVKRLIVGDYFKHKLNANKKLRAYSLRMEVLVQLMKKEFKVPEGHNTLSQ